MAKEEVEHEYNMYIDYIAIRRLNDDLLKDAVEEIEGKHIVRAELWEAFKTVMSRARKDITYSEVDSSGNMYVWGQPDGYIKRKIREACDLRFALSIENPK